MKKIFTLLVGALFAGNTFGQELVINGDLEGAQPEGASCFWVQDTRLEGPTEFGQGQVVHSDGKTGWKSFANIVDDPWKSGNKCIKVHVASQAESEALGTARISNGTYVSWNTQFFIVTTEPMPQDKWIHIKFKIRGSVDGKVDDTQAHQGVGEYNNSGLLPKKPEYFSKKWNSYDLKFQVSSSNVTGNSHSSFGAICFNLSTSAAESFELYFDNISVVMSDEEPVIQEKEDVSEFINFMRKGIDSDDYIGKTAYGTKKDADGNTLKDENGKDIADSVDVYNFMIQVYNPETKGNVLVKAPIVDVDGKRAVLVTTQDFTTKEELDSIDEEGNEVMKTVYYWADGTKIGDSAPARYSSQFFVSSLHKMKEGERFKFSFWVKAKKDGALSTQGHSMPTHYTGWEPLKYYSGELDENGKPKSSKEIPVTTEWQKFEFGDPHGDKVPSSLDGCQTITFDTYIKQEANEYYFIFDECSFTEQNVLISDRTLGEQNINLIVNSDDDEKANLIDATPMLTAFDEENFNFLENSAKDGVKLLTMTEPEDPEEDPEPTFTGLRSWTDGGFVDANGLALDDSDLGILLHFDGESADGKNININVWNNPDAGISFANGKTIPTDFCVSSDGWYYIYHVTLMDEATAAGIQGVKVVKADNGQIYNLAGQRVDANYKGLVIKNGQKTIQK